MASGIAPNLPRLNPTGARPVVTSYDSGYEHSLDRYVDVRLLVQDAEQPSSDVPAGSLSAA